MRKRNRNSTFEDFVKSVDSSVKSNSIGEKYAGFLKQCEELGISSYSLNTIVHYAQMSKKAGSSNKGLDQSFFVSDSETNLVQEIENLSSERDILRSQNTKLEEKCNQVEKQKKQYKTVILLVTLLLISGIITAFVISQKNGNIDYLEKEVSSLESQVSRLNREVQEKTESLESMTEERNRLEGTVQQKNEERNRLEGTVQQKNNEIKQLGNKIESIGKFYPIIIDRIEIGNSDYDGNVQTEYGNKIYDYNTMFLKPKIYYTGLESGDYTLKVKWFTPDGVLSTGNSSPSGFSQSGEYYFYSGDDNTKVLSGWGSNNKGHWKSGTYRIEIWYEDVCLKAKTFSIY